MADAFKLLGSYETQPLSNPLSFAALLSTPINEVKQIKAKQLMDIELDSDPAVPIDFGGVTDAHIVVLKAVGGPVVATIDSAAGSAQLIPFDTYWILMSETNPITALSLTRAPGTVTTCRVFLAEKA